MHVMAPGGQHYHYTTPFRIVIIDVQTVRTSEVGVTLAPLSYVTTNMPYISMKMQVYHTYPTFAVRRNTPMNIVEWQSPLFVYLDVSIML